MNDVDKTKAQLIQELAALRQRITSLEEAETERGQRVLTDALRDTTTALNSTLELDEVLDRILVSMEHVVQHDAANIMLSTGDQAKMVRTRGYIERGLEQWVAEQTFPVDDVESMRQMRDTGKPQCVPDTHNHEGWVIYPETNWIRSSIGVPIMTQGKTIGFIYIDSVKPNHFTPFHAGRLLIFADQAAVAIHNAQLFTTENRRRHIAENLRQAAATLNTSLELDDVLDIILQQLHEIADHDTVTIQQLDGDNLAITACQGFDKPQKVLGLQFPLQPKFPNTRVVSEKKPLAVADVAQDYPHFHDEASTFESGHIRSWLGVPLLVKERLIGIISLDRSEMRAYTDEDIEIVTAFANQAAIAIENARLYEQSQQEIAERKQAEDALRDMAVKLEYQAKHDHLTDLPNRLYFEEALQTALSQANESKRLVGLLYIDLDRFKRINDTLGHDTGDALLQQVARRLENQIRSSDTLARMGGDEFAMILGSLETPQDAAHIARRLITALEEAIIVENHELFVTASIGISLYPRDGDTSEELLRKADTALYRSKDKGRHTFQIYTIDMDETAHENLMLENQLRGAIERGELRPYYQPLVEIATGRIMGVEALLRWNHPELGMVSPGRFIPIAEESGLIVPIGSWVLQEACRQGQVWQQAGHALSISVNVSAIQFQKDDFTEIVANAIRKSGLPANYLQLELTESLLFHDTAKAESKLISLKSLGLGVGIAIDDFGTGQSSLSHLQRPQVDILKIDQSFVRDIGGTSQKASHDETIVKTITALAHELGMNVVAEGVETRKQLTFLHNSGCDIIQGYLFSPAIPADELNALLEKGDRAFDTGLESQQSK
jgi:diguanylate cyclase (GGDEF)-like protein